MKTKLTAYFIGCTIAACALIRPVTALAQGKFSTVSVVSALPLASIVVGTASVASTVAVLPVALSHAGAKLVVKSVESTARGTKYVLERVSDGATVSVEVATRAAVSTSLAVGTLVVVTTVSAGVVLSIAGEAIVFIPNALGLGLLHNERLTY